MELKDKIVDDVGILLEKFSNMGYTTVRGSNTYVLAQIVADYVNKAIIENTKIEEHVNFWTTEDVDILTYLAFDRFRIYNHRSSPRIYEAPPMENDSYIGELISIGADTGLCRVAEDAVAYVDPFRVSLGNPEYITNPVPLRCQYNELVAGSYCAIDKSSSSQRSALLKKADFIESFMDEDGVYIEGDYVILPDIKTGEAMFHPLSDFTKVKANNIKIQLFKRKTQPARVRVKLMREAMDITPDYFKFVVSEIFGKFKYMNRMNKESIKRWVKLRTSRLPYFDEIENQIWIPYRSNVEFNELKKFIRRNADVKWEAKKPAIYRLDLTVDGLSKDEESLLRQRLSESDLVTGVNNSATILRTINTIIGSIIIQEFGMERVANVVYTPVWRDLYNVENSLPSNAVVMIEVIK